jgi:toxin ParE1/3/4
MARRLVWSPQAADDLEEITAYIGRDSAAYARAVASKVLATTNSIQQFPDIGRVVPELGDEHVRERFVHSYRVIYRVDPKRILIVAILHGKRLLGDIAERFH